jgi:Rod binding domain-containing protein
MADNPAALHLATLQQQLATRTETQRRLSPHAPVPQRDRQALQRQIEEFSSVLLSQMLQVMRQTVPRSGLLGGSYAEEMYTSFFDQEIARQMAKRHDLGLSAMFARHFGPAANAPAPAQPPAPPSLQRESGAAQTSVPPHEGVSPRSQQALAAYRQHGQQGEPAAGPASLPVAEKTVKFLSPSADKKE